MGFGDIATGNLRISPPYGAHPVLYDAVDEIIGRRFRQGPNGEPAKKRRDDYLLGAALFMDTPASEGRKTRVYFAASMIARAPNRDIDTQSAVVNNYTSIIPDGAIEDSDEYDSEIELIADAFQKIESVIKGDIADADVSEADVVEETLDGVRKGQSFFERWGSAREELRDEARGSGRGKHGL